MRLLAGSVQERPGSVNIKHFHSAATGSRRAIVLQEARFVGIPNGNWILFARVAENALAEVLRKVLQNS